MTSRSPVENGQDSGARLIQITDTHLYAHAEGELVGMNCDEGLRDVLALVRAHEPEAQALLFTGDASQDNSSQSYVRLEAALSSLNLPQYWIPGNHDELPLLEQVVGPRHPCGQASFSVGGWRVIMLNSSVPDQAYGRLAEGELQFLGNHLSQCREAQVLVCLHHNPVPVQAAWLQKHCLRNPDELFAILDAEPRVRAVLFGHIHHELDVQRNGVRYLGSPSTCVQFHPASEDFALDDLNPGYRWLDLMPDGTVKTGIRRVTGKRYPVDFSGIGY
jgi:Icc protein